MDQEFPNPYGVLDPEMRNHIEKKGRDLCRRLPREFLRIRLRPRSSPSRRLYPADRGAFSGEPSRNGATLMKALIIDGIAFAERMTEAGMEERQARALAADRSAPLRENVVSDLVTRELLKFEMFRLKAELVFLFFGADARMRAAVVFANKFSSDSLAGYRRNVARRWRQRPPPQSPRRRAYCCGGTPRHQMTGKMVNRTQALQGR